MGLTSKCRKVSATVLKDAGHSLRTLGPPGAQTPLGQTEVMRDLGVKLSADFKAHTPSEDAAVKVTRALHILRRTIASRELEVLLPLYKALVRPYLEYCVQAWGPYLEEDKLIMERPQKRFTKWFPHLRGKSYKERLRSLNLFSTRTRRLRPYKGL